MDGGGEIGEGFEVMGCDGVGDAGLPHCAPHPKSPLCNKCSDLLCFSPKIRLVGTPPPPLQLVGLGDSADPPSWG